MSDELLKQQIRTLPTSEISHVREAELSDGWVQFGDRLLLCSPDRFPDPSPSNLQGRAAQAAREPGAVLENGGSEQLYLVVQKGRSFQLEYPDIKVLLDKGRYLAVMLSEQKAEQISVHAAPCFTVQPLQPNSIVFETVAAANFRQTTTPSIQALVDNVQRSTFARALEHLVSFHTRMSTTSFYAEAARWCQSELDGLGYETRQQSISIGNRTSSNVIADKVGSGSGERNLLLAVAHLDSINSVDGPSAHAPGADDNGSGSAGILEIARVLSRQPAVHDLRVVLMGGEEQGLHGSRQFVASLLPEDRSRLVGVINMDMIGSLNTTSPAVLLEGAALSQQLIDELAQMAATYTTLEVQTSLHPFNSDHVSFLDAGLPAVLTIEGADGANANVHTGNDLLTHIDYDLAVEILKMNVAYLASKLS